MSALKGSLTYARFYLEDSAELPASFQAKFLKAIQSKVLRPLDPNEPDPERSGWCRLGEPFELELDHESIFKDDFIALGLRTDRWAIPAPLLRAKLREAEGALLTRSGRERLSRKEKTELKEMVSKKLRRQMAPSTRHVDMIWSLDEKLVRFFSHAPKPGAVLQELFQKTFGLKLIPESPYTLAARLGLSQGEERAWQSLEASAFEMTASFDLEITV